MIQPFVPRLLTIALVLGLVAHACGDTPFYWDDFERESLVDSPYDWVLSATGVEVELANGNATITPTTDKHVNVWVQTPQALRDFSIRAQYRFHDPVSLGINPWFGFIVRDIIDGIGNNYWAGPSVDGQLWFGQSRDSVDTVHTTFQAFAREDLSESDIHLQLDGIGTEFSLWAWIDGEEKPEEPQITYVDEDDWTPEGDMFGFIMNPSRHLTGIDIRYLALLPGVPGDFNGNSALDAEDIDLVAGAIRKRSTNRALDLTGDAELDQQDLTAMVYEIHGTYFGDANLDGEFNSTDFVQVFQSGEYEDGIAENSRWTTGDWNGDAEFDASDFVFAFQDSGYEKGPRRALPVPEPRNLISVALLWGVICLSRTRLSAKRCDH